MPDSLSTGMAPGMDLHLLACRAGLRARKALRFETPAANRFRGALGFALPEPVFRPSTAQGPSGLRDLPRPFILRAHPLDGRSFAAGERFHVDLNLFTAAEPFRAAFAELEWAELEQWSESPLILCLDAPVPPLTTVCVRFLTPTELKPPVPPGALPPFATLLARLRDRISTLRACYGGGPLDIDHASLRAGAEAIRATAGALEWHTGARRSTRTGQTHPLGGFTGWTHYQGDLAPFLPYLEAGFHTGVGRQTVWGKGLIALERP